MRTIFSFGVLFALAVTGAVAQAQLPDSVFGNPSILPAQPATVVASWGYYRPVSSGAANLPGDYTAAQSVVAPTAPAANASPALSPPSVDVPAGSSNQYLDAMGRPWGKSADTPDEECDEIDEECDEIGDIVSDVDCRPVWFGYVGGLWMTRDNENPVWFSYYDNDESIQRNRSIEAGMGWGSGFETRIGRILGQGGAGGEYDPSCEPSNLYALEAVYWGVFPSTEEINLFNPGPGISLNTTYDFTRLNYSNTTNPVTSVDGWFNDAERHRVRRSYEFHNAELNLLSGSGFGYEPVDAAGSRFGWTAGVRYFQFAESLQFATSDSSPTFGAVPDDEMYYDINVRNHLIGGQVGAYGDVPLWGRLGARGVGKLGVFGNYISQSSRIAGADGVAAWVGAGPNANRRYDVRSNKNDVAFLAELDLSLTYRLWGRWRALLGYRVVAVTGVAMSTEQIPYNFAGIGDVEDVDSNGSLILHGGYAGVELNW